MIQLNYWGHACFELTDGQTTLVFDPFLTGNPAAQTTADKINCQYILVSHGHGDHFGDAAEIAKANGATVIGIPEICALAEGAAAHGMNLGGSYTFPFGKVTMVQAFHSGGAPGACAAGFIVEFAGRTFYFAGDTALFGDMQLFAKRKIDYALLPIGDNYTMGIDDAVEAVKLLQPKHVIPMHYNTWPPIAADPNLFKEKAEAASDAVVHVVAPGGSLTIE